MRFPFSNIQLLHASVSLIVLDIVITVIGVWLMGATELNPLAGIFGFLGFIAVKIVLSFGAITIIHKCLLTSAPTASRYGMMVIVVIYTAVCTSNLCYVVGAIV